MNEATKKLVEEAERLLAECRESFDAEPEFRAFSREAVPALCAEVRRLDEDNERLRRMLAGAEAVGGVVAFRVSPKKRQYPDCNDTGLAENGEGPNRGGFVS